MAKQIFAAQTAAPFDYELFEGDPENLKTVFASSKHLNPWIEPAKLKLRHRIGRGPFGDVWLATHHQSTDDYDEYHEVAVKMLHNIKEDYMKAVFDKFEDQFSRCRGVRGVCWQHGISVMNGKICIVMKFYEGSIADKMAGLREGKLSLPEVLRYGIDLAQGILELHSQEIFVLNVKPSNVLLSANDEAILGDFGIPYMLLDIPLPSSDVASMLGTPNYMAPEQWQPEKRGPISYETDSWGFACTIVEMVTGVQPWRGRSVDEIYCLVVRKQEKPDLPSGLPPPLENVLLGCFEYDLRSRPLMTDILHVFQCLHNEINRGGGWTDLPKANAINKSSSTGHTEWFLSKDRLQVGDTVRSRNQPNSCRSESMDVPDGKVVGLKRDTDQDGFVLVRVHGIHDPLRVQVSTLERVIHGFAAGDWVRCEEEAKKHSPVGILHSINRDGNVEVAFIGLKTLWKGNSSQFQMAESYHVGQFVRLRTDILRPRFEWPRKQGGDWATGKIHWILPNGCLLVKFPGRLSFTEECSSFMADPAEVEGVTFSTCPGVVKKYQHLEDFHWSVRPLLIALGLFTAMKLGIFAGKKMVRSKVKEGRGSSSIQQMDSQCQFQSSSNPAWIPPPVANILFREGVNTTAAL